MVNDYKSDEEIKLPSLDNTSVNSYHTLKSENKQQNGRILVPLIKNEYPKNNRNYGTFHILVYVVEV